MEHNIKQKIKCIINHINNYGLTWKEGKDIHHLQTRKDYGHIPLYFTLLDYENVIIKIINGRENDVYIYQIKHFTKDYFVFGDGEWVVIISDDGIMETSFHIDTNYHGYLSEKKGYKYLGKVSEVLQ